MGSKLMLERKIALLSTLEIMTCFLFIPETIRQLINNKPCLHTNKKQGVRKHQKLKCDPERKNCMIF